jgi:hypothetical protein
MDFQKNSSSRYFDICITINGKRNFYNFTSNTEQEQDVSEDWEDENQNKFDNKSENSQEMSVIHHTDDDDFQEEFADEFI